jgi:peptide deformylase
MPLLAIRHVPDLVLRTICARVENFDEADLGVLSADMLETMYHAPGRGLAAPQIGLTLRIFVMDVEWKTGTPDPRVFINPVITNTSVDRSVLQEGCLSIPGETCLVERPVSLGLKWQSLDGTVATGDFDGFAARCIQHEMDHLDGVLCTDLPSPAKGSAA